MILSCSRVSSARFLNFNNFLLVDFCSSQPPPQRPVSPTTASLSLSFSLSFLICLCVSLSPRGCRFARAATTRLMTIFNRASRAAILNPALPRHISTGDQTRSPLSSESTDTLHPLLRVGGLHWYHENCDPSFPLSYPHNLFHVYRRKTK